MTSEIRTNSLKSRAGLSTVTMTDTGPMFSGITTFVDNSGFTFGVGGGTSIFTPATNVLTFGTNNTEKIRIDANGNANISGITTASNFKTGSSNLHSTGLTVGNTLVHSTGINVGTGATVHSPASNVLTLGTNNNERIRIESGGGLKFTGQGTSIPVAGILHHTNNNLYVRGGTSGLILGNQDNTNTIGIFDSNFIRFETNNGTERLRIGNAGQIGLSGENYGSSGQVLTSQGSSSAPTWTTVSGTTINNNANNRIITGSGTANTLEAESSFIFDAGQLLVGTGSASNRFKNGNGNGATPKFQFETANVDEQNDISLTFGRNNAFGAEIILAKHRASTVGGHTVVQSGDRLGGINFAGSDGTHFRPAALIQTRVDGTPGTGDMPGRLQFHTTADGASTPTERFRIDSSGSSLFSRTGYFNPLDQTAAVQILTPTNGGDCGLFVHGASQQGGTSSPHACIRVHAHNCANDASEQLALEAETIQQLISRTTGVKSTVTASYNATFCYYGVLNKNINAYTDGFTFYSKIVETGSGGTSYHMRCEDNGSIRMQMFKNGNIQNTNNSYGQISDVKYKENIVDASSQWDDIKNIKVRKFNFKESSGFETHTQIGVVAQELETISPGLIETENDIEINEDTGEGMVTGTTKSVKYSILYMKAIKALQEAQARIEKLEEDNIALRARVTNLEDN